MEDYFEEFEKLCLICNLLSQEKEMSEEDYIKEFEKLCLNCDLQEKKTFKIAGVVKWLSKNITKKVEVTHYASFSDACNLALMYEVQANGGKNKSLSFLTKVLRNLLLPTQRGEYF